MQCPRLTLDHVEPHVCPRPPIRMLLFILPRMSIYDGAPCPCHLPVPTCSPSSCVPHLTREMREADRVITVGSTTQRWVQDETAFGLQPAFPPLANSVMGILLARVSPLLSPPLHSPSSSIIRCCPLILALSWALTLAIVVFAYQCCSCDPSQPTVPPTSPCHIPRPIPSRPPSLANPTKPCRWCNDASRLRLLPPLPPLRQVRPRLRPPLPLAQHMRRRSQLPGHSFDLLAGTTSAYLGVFSGSGYGLGAGPESAQGGREVGWRV